MSSWDRRRPFCGKQFYGRNKKLEHAHGSLVKMNIKVLRGQKQRKRIHLVNFKQRPVYSTGHQGLSDVWTLNNVCAFLTAVDLDVQESSHLKELNAVAITCQSALTGITR